MTVPNDPAKRAAVVAEVRRWYRTPYLHMGRRIGLGVDCAQLPAAVYHAVGLIPPIRPNYPHDWHMHRSEELYVQWVLEVGAREIEEAQVGDGDLVIFRYGRTFSHGAIVERWPLCCHARFEQPVHPVDVLEDEDLRGRPRRFFSFFEE